jgi:hypothetical protein
MDEYKLLNIRLQMESLITEREMMIQDNNERTLTPGLCRAYSPDDFIRIQQCFEGLIADLRG